MSEKTCQNVEVDPKGQATNTKISPEGTYMANASYLKVENVAVTDGKNVFFSKQKLTAESASEVKPANNIITRPKNIEFTSRQFYVENAEEVKVPCGI